MTDMTVLTRFDDVCVTCPRKELRQARHDDDGAVVMAEVEAASAQFGGHFRPRSIHRRGAVLEETAARARPDPRTPVTLDRVSSRPHFSSYPVGLRGGQQ